MRNSLLCSSVTHWFRQLRRLQSLRHSAIAGNTSLSAVTHRLELWSAILAAKGFAGSFRHWWQLYGHSSHPDAPTSLLFAGLAGLECFAGRAHLLDLQGLL